MKTIMQTTTRLSETASMSGSTIMNPLSTITRHMLPYAAYHIDNGLILVITTCRLLFACLFVCVLVCVFVRLRISPLRIKLAASHFARWFIGVQGRESHIFVKFASKKPQNRTKRPARGPRPPACKHYRRDART